ncbi:glycosyltransferase family 2 protein [Candidatus Daviesbacteria bacterium]|nr:glycosyltransferase family 2 protein [Candidatus Daviesbacteria bacterium]
MRIILTFLAGFISFFFIGDLLNRLFKQSIHSFIGLSVIILGFVIGFLGKNFIAPPLDSLLSVFLLGSGLGLTIHHLLSKRYIISEKLETNFVKKHETFFERTLEILPGALTWIALTSPFWLSFTLPFAVAYLILIADIYWLLNSLKIATLIYLGYRKMTWAKKQPWLEKLKSDFPGKWNKYHHLILLPTYKEGLEVLAPAFEAIANSNFPKEKIFLAVGFEEWADKSHVEEITQYLDKYKGKINILTTVHEIQPGEIKGPGSNRNWMVKNAVKEFEHRNIRLDTVFVTTLDADFVIHPEFLSGALHKYLSTPENIRDKRTYTGVFLYYNNYWQAPTPSRLIAVGTALWQLSEMVGSDKYQNFASLSINLKPLLEIGLWIPNKVNDDSGFYWKAYFHFKGDYKVIPHYMTISADATVDVNLLKTFQNQYLQLKRWAYGVEHIPFIFREYFKRGDINFWDKTDKLAFVLWANMRWGFLALFITFGGLLIPYVNPSYSQSAVAINLPIISSWILTAAFLGLFSTIYVHEKTAPKRPASWSKVRKVWSYIQWLLIPVVLVTISTLPAIDAQTSLMFGRYLEYRVTNKVRLKNQSHFEV